MVEVPPPWHRKSLVASGLNLPRVFADPLATAIIGKGAAAELATNEERERHPHARAFRAFIAARSRCAEEQLAQAVARGVRQYVILGAGLDTFACRSPYGGEVRVFEVDHPATSTIWSLVPLSMKGSGWASTCSPPRSRLVASHFARPFFLATCPARSAAPVYVSRRTLEETSSTPATSPSARTDCLREEAWRDW